MPKSPRKTAPPITPIALPTAGILRRLAALVYDAFLLFGLLVVPLFITTAIISPPQNLPLGAVTHDLPIIAPRPILFAYTILVIASFYVYFWRKSGQTLGMQAWRLRVDNEQGGRANWFQCAIRAAVGFISLSCAGLGFWWAWIDKDRRCWHDSASNTRVVVLPKPVR